MPEQMPAERVAALAEAVRAAYGELTFSVCEIGAAPLAGETEPFHALLEAFPGSRVMAFELDAELCATLHRTAPAGLEYVAVALGRAAETRPLYLANHALCTSLYPPDESIIELYNNMEVARLRSVGSVTTESLDGYLGRRGIERVDFIKIDVQGAELDVFEGGRAALSQVVAVVSEAELVPIYVGQPLFGDLCRFLGEGGLMFHKLLSLEGRALKPIIFHRDPNHAVQHMWSDAMFIRDVRRLGELADEQLLRLGTLAYLYESYDVTFACFRRFDERRGSELCRRVLGW